jgi:hypothetical protein
VTDSNPFRSEIEQILTDHPRTRFAKVLLGMNRGLTQDLASMRGLRAPYHLRCRIADRATLWPLIPCTPMPGGVDAEQMYTPGTPVR